MKKKLLSLVCFSCLFVIAGCKKTKKIKIEKPEKPYKSFLVYDKPTEKNTGTEKF